MKIVINTVGLIRNRTIPWPDGWPPPREGDTLDTSDESLIIRRVVWMPAGDRHDPEPRVYVVAGLTER